MNIKLLPETFDIYDVLYYFRVKELSEQADQSSSETKILQEDVAFKESELEV